MPNVYVTICDRTLWASFEDIESAWDEYYRLSDMGFDTNRLDVQTWPSEALAVIRDNIITRMQSDYGIDSVEAVKGIIRDVANYVSKQRNDIPATGEEMANGIKYFYGIK